MELWAPYEFKIDPAFLKSGRNIIQVEVTNSMANHMDQVSLRSGLVGPVEIELETESLNKIGYSDYRVENMK